MATRSTAPMLPPASPIAVATRPSIPGRWSISTRRTTEYCAETEAIEAEPSAVLSLIRGLRVRAGAVVSLIAGLRVRAGDRSGAGAPRHGRRAGDDHVDPRHDDRQRRDRDARPRAALVADLYPVGQHRLSAGAGHGDPADGLDDGALRRQAGVDDVRRVVPGRLRPVRVRLEHRVADRVPRAAGVRRRHDHADRAGDPGAGRRAAADGPDHERDWRADAAGPGPWAGDRRADRRQLVVALDLL